MKHPSCGLSWSDVLRPGIYPTLNLVVKIPIEVEPCVRPHLENLPLRLLTFACLLRGIRRSWPIVWARSGQALSLRITSFLLFCSVPRRCFAQFRAAVFIKNHRKQYIREAFRILLKNQADRRAELAYPPPFHRQLAVSPEAVR